MTSNQPESDLPAKLASPARRALVNAGFLHLKQIANVTESEIKQLHGIGPNALDLLRRTLQEKGLSFAPEKDV